MEHFAEYKVPGGKLVSVKLECDEKIVKIKVLGDFFLYPEETLTRIEESLIGMSKDASEKELVDEITKVAAEYGAEMIGVTPQAIAHTIRMAIG
jgi:lipoate---protein ligase